MIRRPPGFTRPDPLFPCPTLFRSCSNIRGAMGPGGTRHAIVWRGPHENVFMTTAERAAAPLLPAMPPRKPDAPGQFAFADPERVLSILWDSGWSKIAVEPLDVECSFPASALLAYVTRLGPLGIFLRQASAADRDRVEIGRAHV